MDEIYPPSRPPAPQPPRPSGLPWLLALLAVLAAMLFLPTFVERIYYAMTLGRERAEVDSARGQLPSPTLTEISRQFAVVAKAIEPSVVHIDTVQAVDGEGNPFGVGLTPQAIGQGSGVVIDEEGYILTNNHVVANASEIRVNLSGNESRKAEVIGLDETTDLAVLKIPSGGLIAAQWGDSEALEVGSLVWAVGNPFGLDRSVTLGIVSAKNRRRFRGMSAYQDFLQTDAAINPGNSGGPLVDVSGKVVGINTAIVGRSYQGVSFSIPTSIAKEIYDRLRENGKITRGFMGVTLGDLDAESAKEAGLSNLQGARVLGVGPGTPAAKAGILSKDVIVGWDGQEVHDATELTLLVGKTKVGETIKVKLIRGGQPQEVELVVEERPQQIIR
jgi:S1-C subfamily serine protease